MYRLNAVDLVATESVQMAGASDPCVNMSELRTIFSSTIDQNVQTIGQNVQTIGQNVQTIGQNVQTIGQNVQNHLTTPIMRATGPRNHITIRPIDLATQTVPVSNSSDSGFDRVKISKLSDALLSTIGENVQNHSTTPIKRVIGPQNDIKLRPIGFATESLGMSESSHVRTRINRWLSNRMSPDNILEDVPPEIFNAPYLRGVFEEAKRNLWAARIDIAIEHLIDIRNSCSECPLTQALLCAKRIAMRETTSAAGRLRDFDIRCDGAEHLEDLEL